MTRTHTASAAVLLSTVLLLAGCGGQSGEAEPATTGDSGSSSSASAAPETPAVEPAAGETITGTGYTFTVPEGWGIPEEDFATGQVDVFAADLTDIEDGFADNVNVLLSPAGEITPEQVESLGVDELEAAGATDVMVGERITVADSESAHLSAALDAQGAQYSIDQFYVTGDGQTFVVTFSFSPTVTEAERADVYESVLATWSWA